MEKQAFINGIKTGAIAGMTKYGILASLTIAQAILESSWGDSAPGNNLFGIKWTSGYA
jgi:flagellum-specific peptidoglycan hydrolase FlgJ